MKVGLLGEKLGHSHSPMLHFLLGGYEYGLFEVSKDSLDSFMYQKDFDALNVTIPYKQSVIPYLDELSDIAQRIGAVNTIVNKGGKLYGYNTDYYGLKALINEITPDLRGKRVLILGTGGTAKTASVVCKDLGASSISYVSRNKSQGVYGYEDKDEFTADSDFLINTTPVGMYPNDDGCPIDIDDFFHLDGVVDVIYNPLRTRLVQSSLRRDIPSVGGLKMLVVQAAYSNSFFFENPVKENKIEDVYRKMKNSLENIVLTGMPTSGKSKLGREYAYVHGYDFIDTDELIMEKVGMDIPTYMAKFGVEAFRDVEEQVIASLSNRHHAVISTGGGAILRSSNIENLKKNGRIYYRDVPKEYLKPRDNRPLSANQSDLDKLYEERMPIYLSTCDVRLEDGFDLDEAIRLIEEDRK